MYQKELKTNRTSLLSFLGRTTLNKECTERLAELCILPIMGRTKYKAVETIAKQLLLAHQIRTALFH